MSCYLCAYQKTHVPKRPVPLPAGSPASPTDPLGTCGMCSVFACSGHGSRYGQFLCAMCRAGTAIATVVAPSASAGEQGAATRAAVEVARRVGEETSRDRQERVYAALVRITSDAAQGREPALRVVEPRANLVWDFAGAIEPAVGRRGGNLPAVRDPARARLLNDVPGPVEISLDAVSGAIRGQFAAAPATHVTGDSAVVVAGALVMAVAVADDPDATESGSVVAHPSEIEIPAPWDMSHPILLTPAAWLIAAAYLLA